MPMTLKIKSGHSLNNSVVEINGNPIAITSLKLTGKINDRWVVDISFMVNDLEVEIAEIVSKREDKPSFGTVDQILRKAREGKL